MRNARDRARYGPAVESAREGIRVFSEAAAAAEGKRRDGGGGGGGGGSTGGGGEAGWEVAAGVRLRALRDEDWRFLVSLCDDDVREDYEGVFGAATAAGTMDAEDTEAAVAAAADADAAAADDCLPDRGRRGFTTAAARHRRAMDAFVEAQIRKHSQTPLCLPVQSERQFVGAPGGSGGGGGGSGGGGGGCGRGGVETEVKGLSMSTGDAEGHEPKTFAERMRLKRLAAAGGAEAQGGGGRVGGETRGEGGRRSLGDGGGVERGWEKERGRGGHAGGGKW